MAAKLPIGIQSFEKLRRDGFAYVDKTAYVYELARAGVPCFLSRPRRFGKSLLVSTLRAYFEGKRELFEGLAIERLEAERASREGAEAWVARPVFHLDFNGADYTREGGLEGKLEGKLRRWEADCGLGDTDGLGYGDRFWRLLEVAHGGSGHRCAVLVDEYDKPLLESMEDPGLEERNRAMLKGLYSVLKGADEHIRFAFVTGVTKFSKVSMFSDLNNLADISLERDYAAVCGITEGELLASFGEELGAMAADLGLTGEELLGSLREQYDGYCFHPDGPGGPGAPEGPGAPGEPGGSAGPGGGSPAAGAAAGSAGGAAGSGGRRVYNPFSLLRALQSRRLGSYWFETGTPTFLARRMKGAGLDPKRLTDGSIYATERRLSDYRADDPDPVPLLFQAGYLTIRSLEPRSGRYSLAAPNGEVEWGLVESLLPEWAPGYAESRGTDVFALWDLVEAGDTDGMRRVIEALFASIPYTRGDDPFENYFQAVLWLVFALLGRYVGCEVRQTRGRVDCVVEARAHVYVIEFKRGGTAAEALAQIEERGYAAPFAADPRQLHRIGCSFDPETRLMSGWQEA